jgi:hypothetical protein
MTHFSHDYEQGIKDERDRIVALIEAEMHRIHQWRDYTATVALGNIRAELIKNEQND